MNFLNVQEAIDQRRAVRSYTAEVPSNEVIAEVARLALEAPSAFNIQMRDLVVVRDTEQKQKLFDASGQQQFLDAPVVFVCVGRSEVMPDDAEDILGAERVAGIGGIRSRMSESALREAGLKDALLLAGFLLVAAQSVGLATSPTTGWDEEKVKAAIGLAGRSDRSIGLVVAAGYPNEAPTHPGRAANRLVAESF
ncbi:dehydrogenase [Corynebacterium poyangense]|uniref:Dehydrogenase n=1 Tax=Corynebacterium poyangense TaxID=2684405 RepID=A0A7H0SL94_9CORY|nr:nitroreductase family protein [Corynebacterium poyangense]MBZ8177409.1 dehydrogenase [Corynebacterium poyangense]QNQ89319.1 dehydrogenase [Corynebacterium poyangense]